MLNETALCPAARRIACEFCGNEEAVAALGEMVENRRLPHAFILEGADGLGKQPINYIDIRIILTY